MDEFGNTWLDFPTCPHCEAQLVNQHLRHLDGVPSISVATSRPTEQVPCNDGLQVH